MTRVRKMFRLFSRADRAKAVGLVFLMLAATGLEVLSIGMILPFLAFVQDPRQITQHRLTSRLLEWAHLESPERALVVLALTLGAVYLSKNTFLAALYYLQYRFLYNRQLALSHRLFESYLYRSYPFHLQRNSAVLIHTLMVEVVQAFHGVIVPASVVLVESTIVVAIAAFLLTVEPVSALIAFAGMAGAAALLYRTLRPRLLQLGAHQQRHSIGMLKAVTEGLGAVKETKILGREQFFIDAFVKSGREYAHALQFFRFVADTPRLFIEVVAVGGMLLGALAVIVRHGSISMVLPVLGLFGIAAARIMPALNRVITSSASITHSSAAVDVVYQDLLDAEHEGARPADIRPPREDSAVQEEIFRHTLELIGVSYRYPEAAVDTLHDVSLSIRRGQSVAFVGPSGAGKTTLVDVILGLLTPTTGRVLIDGRDVGAHLRAWQSIIGYIPQAVFLADDSIRKNVAFGLSDEAIDEERVRFVLRAAQLESLVEALPGGVDTVIGERGIRLSGGQRQRIGIARAFYHDPRLLVMDEAMSALDNQTEQNVGREIRALGRERTVIIIAHRLTTVQHCDTVFFLKDGRLVQADTYQALLSGNREFKDMVEAGMLAVER